METLLQQRVRERLAATGKKPIPAATAVGLGRDYIRDILAGKKQSVLGANLERLAKTLECEPRYFTDPDASVREPGTEFRGFPLIGLVGAGGEGDYEDDYAKGAAREYIEPLPGMDLNEKVLVLEIDGESMMPAAFPKDLVFFGARRDDVDTFVNQRVMAQLKNGKKFFKLLKRGSVPGTFTLRSFNPATPDIEDVEVEWVLPYRGSKPRDF
jgi:repressor LexA